MTYEMIGTVLAVILSLNFGLTAVGVFHGHPIAMRISVIIDLVSIVLALILSNFAKDR